MAGFLHSLPLFMDELQLAKDRHGRVNFNVYELAAGSGKLRGNSPEVMKQLAHLGV